LLAVGAIYIRSMALTASYINPLSFSQNRVFASFETDSLTSSGVVSINEIALTGILFSLKTITIRYGDIIVNLASSGLPPNGNNIKTGAGDLAHAQAIIPYLQANFHLNRDFTITVPNDAQRPRLVLTAKKTGPSYNFVTILTSSTLAQNVTPGVDPQAKKNLTLSLQCDVYKAGSNSLFDTVYAERIPFSSTQVQINLAAILDAELTPDFPADFASTSPWRGYYSVRQYRLRVAEGFGDPLTFGPNTEITAKNIAFGGTGFQQGMNKLPQDWVRGATAADDKFLRYGPLVRYVQTDEPQWLSFLNTRSTYASLSIAIRIDYTDNTEDTLSVSITNGLPVNEKLHLPVWPTALGLQSVQPAKAIRSYYVRLKSGSTNVSQEVQYVLDYANREHKQYFVYFNSVGGWDSFLAYGRSSYGVEFKNSQIQRPIPASYSQSDADLSDVGAQMRDTFTVATSYYSREQLRYFRDFFGARYRYRWIQGKALAISIRAGNFEEGTDGQNQFAHTFQYVYAHQNTNFD
jgi:hypothetical protein